MRDHGITDQQWMDFHDGKLDAPSRATIEGHLAACAECASLHEELVIWRERLAGEGARIRQAMELPEPELERMLAASLERVAAARPAAWRGGAAEAVAMLRTLLAPVLGAGTVRAACDAALRLAAPDGITAATWATFTRALGEIIRAICGIAAGRLVGRAAETLAMDHA
jgi:anti-sigma factor RsiW